LNVIGLEPVANKKTIKRKYSNTALLLLSLLLHVAIVYLLVFNSDIPQRIKTVDEVIINSYLLEKKTLAENVSVDGSPLTTLPENQRETSPKPIDESTVEEKAPIIVSKNATNKTVQTPTEVKKQQEPDIQKSSNVLSHKHLSTTGLPTSTIDLLQKDAYEAMLIQETELFNKLKNSPIIDTIGTLDTTKRPEANQPNIVYCDGAVTNTIVALGSLTGGNVQCKALEIQSFIDKRLTKNAEQP